MALLALIVTAALAAIAGVVLAGDDPDVAENNRPVPADGLGAEASCDRFAAPAGSDVTGAGTRPRPYRTASKLVASLGAGETGCFRSGEYSFPVLELDTPEVTLAPFGDEQVTLEGDIKLLPGASGAVIEGMSLNGATGRNTIGPRIYADEVVLRDNVITNEHTGICVQVSDYFDHPPPRGVVIEENRIHDCGRLPPTNHDHGVYLAETREAIVRDNWIHDNADLGIHMYPDAQGSLITGNVIDSNGQGIVFAGDGEDVSSNNLVTGNVISNSVVRWNVYSGAQGPVGTGNVLRGNCLFASNPDPFFNSNGGVETPSTNFAARNNTTGDPMFVDREEGDLRVGVESSCADVLP
jgi:Right handed beta helix region